MKKFVTDQCHQMTAAVDSIGFIQISDDGKAINTTLSNLLQIVAEKHKYEPVINWCELAKYDTPDQTSEVYEMFLDWLDSDTKTAVFTFPIWDAEINKFNPYWDWLNKRQMPIV
jgi:hypothetical protein